jgi:hypothetical protein
MLQLQLKNLAVPKLPKKAIFFIKLSFFCTSVHVFALLLFFLIPYCKKSLFLDTRQTTHASIVFVPLLKTISSQGQVTLLNNSINQQKESLHSVIAKPVQKKEVVKKPIKKMVPKKTVIQKKPVPKKIIELKKLIQKKPVKKIIPVPKKVEQKKEEIKKEPIPKKKPEVVPEKKVEQTTLKENNVQLIGQDDMELLMLSNELKQAISKIWKRPTNISTNAVCEVRVILSSNGIKEVIIEKPSYALALDISVRNFLLRYDFPKHMFGKELTILF